VPLEAVPAELPGADLVVGCTGAVGTVLAAATVEAALPARAGRPLVLLDLALPRDFDGAAGVLPGVHYLDLAALQEPAIRLGAHRDVERARQIVGEEVAGRLGARRATAVAPTVTALRARAAEVVDAELARLDSRLPGLDATARDEVARTVHRVVQTLLHAPTVRVKQLAERPGGGAYADALRELFDLDPAATAAVAAAVLPSDGGQR
jgi:glutamyl-tRNA reductase